MRQRVMTRWRCAAAAPADPRRTDDGTDVTVQAIIDLIRMIRRHTVGTSCHPRFRLVASYAMCA
jgi:hypothetical protein